MIDRGSTASEAPRSGEAFENPRPGEASASPAAARDRDFYIGYQAHAPTALGRFHRHLAGLLILAAAAFGVGLAGLMRPLPPAHFEFGQLRSFEGWISEGPYPSLLEPALARGKELRLQGEIVGAKCYLGVMNPGESTLHRDCAALCIRGGVPALFVLRDSEGREQSFILVDEEGRPHGNEILPLVGLPLTLTGRAAAQAGLDSYFVSRSSIQELAAGQGPRTAAFETTASAQALVCDLLP